MPDPKESALSRWSRLKQESEAGEGAGSRSAEKHPRDPTQPQEAAVVLGAFDRSAENVYSAKFIRH
jgi:hypothetical protein